MTLNAYNSDIISGANGDYVKGEVLVEFADNDALFGNINSMLSLLLGNVKYTLKQYKNLSAGLIHTDDLSVDELMKKLSKVSNIIKISPNYVVRLIQSTNDDLYSKQWAIENTGQNGGTPNADIDAKEAWDISMGSSNVVVAVVDTGVDYNHEDLRENMWDGSSFNLSHHGYDFSGDNDNDPRPGHWHGTHIAGIISAVANNRKGVAGVAAGVSIMALKVFSDNDNSAKSSDILEAYNFIADKVDHGVNIVAINASYGGSGYSDVMKDAIHKLGEKGIILCAAAGNDSKDNDNKHTYPSDYDLPNIISVTATDNQDELADFSNYGVNSVDIAAPGVSIVSTMTDNRYAYASGTSMATPHVTATIALLASYKGDQSVAGRRDEILSSVDHINSLANKVAIGGRLNLFNMLNYDNGNNDGGDNNADVTTWTTGYYDNNEDRRKEFHINGATRLKVTITGETEKNCDYIYIYDANGNQIAKLDGSIDKTLEVDGSSIATRLTSDGSVTEDGVTVTIESI